MEEELLREMIRDRDTQIHLIQRKMDEQNKKTERGQKELEELRTKRKETVSQREKDKVQLLKRFRKAVQQYAELKDTVDMKKQQQGAALHAYTEVMKTVATPESRDSAYVMRMQAQLCKAMHSMGMVENQLAMSTKHAEQIQKFLKECNTATVEEKSQVELKLMNDLVIQDNDRREVETKHKSLMEAFWSEKDALEQKIEDANDSEQDEDEDDEEREELMEILTQGCEEIERMEAEIKGQKQKITKMKQQLGQDPSETSEIDNAEGEEKPVEDSENDGDDDDEREVDTKDEKDQDDTQGDEENEDEAEADDGADADDAQDIEETQQ